MFASILWHNDYPSHVQSDPTLGASKLQQLIDSLASGKSLLCSIARYTDVRCGYIQRRVKEGCKGKRDR